MSSSTDNEKDRKNEKSFFRRRRKRELTAISVGILAYFCYMLFAVTPDSPVVDTTLGQIKGTIANSRLGRPFYEFLGLPYAQPPVGKLRFAAPELPEKWDGIRSATSYGSQCLQIDVITGFMLGTEDCLFLNVFTPVEVLGTKRLLPVMVWIHGGGFISGASDIYRPHYFMDEDIVLVTVNYRLASLGFLNTGDEAARGNQGMKDQVMALKWVQDNIRNFNGNPQQVTIFGESAGGGAAHYHLLSPMSKGLFSKVISQSGTVLMKFLYSPNPREQSRDFAQRLGCPTEPSEAIVECLRSMDARDIVVIHKEMLIPPRPTMGIFAPSVEGVLDKNTFLPGTPLELVNSGNVTKAPWMTGVDSEEGLPFATEILHNKTLVNWGNSDWDEFISRVLFLNRSNFPAIPSQIRNYYFKNSSEFGDTSLGALSDVHSARLFFYYTHYTATQHAKHSPVYLYYFNYPTEFGFLRLMRALRGKNGIPVIELLWEITWYYTRKVLGMEIERIGASHGEEMLLQFTFPFIPGAPLGSPDYQMSRELVKTWVSFATDHTTLRCNGTTWEAVDLSKPHLRYLEFASDGVKMIDEPFADQMRFWKSTGAI